MRDFTNGNAPGIFRKTHNNLTPCRKNPFGPVGRPVLFDSNPVFEKFTNLLGGLFRVFPVSVYYQFGI